MFHARKFFSKKGDKNFTVESYQEYESILQAHHNSKNSQKLWNYFLEIIKQEYFKDIVVFLRKKYKMPRNGFEPDFVNGRYRYRFPPDAWIYKDDLQKIQELENEIIEKICKKYRLHYFDFSDIVLRFLFFNSVRHLAFEGCSLFRVCDVVEEKNPFNKKVWELVQRSDDIAYPIAIRISPYASKNDLIDFIKNNVIWEQEIEFLQNKYKDKDIKIGKVKSKNKEVQERNDFIYKNRHKTLKEIGKLLADRNIFLDDGHISKIRSLERQKRKEV